MDAEFYQETGAVAGPEGTLAPYSVTGGGGVLGGGWGRQVHAHAYASPCQVTSGSSAGFFFFFPPLAGGEEPTSEPASFISLQEK